MAIERSKASIGNDWLRSIFGAAVIGVAAMIALIALTRIALRRARHETSTLARAAEAFADRAGLEVQLHRMQRLEGVALLATGMAYEFNHFLTNAQGNIVRLEAAIKDVDAGQQGIIAALKDSCTQASVLIK